MDYVIIQVNTISVWPAGCSLHLRKEGVPSKAIRDFDSTSVCHSCTQNTTKELLHVWSK